MSEQVPTDEDRSGVSVTEYVGNPTREDTRPAAFVQLNGDGRSQSNVLGEGAEALVKLDGSTVTLTAVAELEGADRLLGRDLLTVGIRGKDLPQSRDEGERVDIDLNSGPFKYGTLEVTGYASATAPHAGIIHDDEPTSVHILSQLGHIEIDVTTEDDDGVRVGSSAHLNPDQAEEVAHRLLAAAEDLREAQADE